MSDPYLGEIRLFSFPFPPKGWAFCTGAILPISTNQALFSLFGTMYGGNGTTTFALPNLQGRTPIGTNAQYPIGMASGEAQHALTTTEIPYHNHIVKANVDPNSSSGTNLGAGDFFGASRTNLYGPMNLGAQTMLESNTVNMAGNGAGHNNMMPSIAMNYCVALFGIFPSPS